MIKLKNNTLLKTKKGNVNTQKHYDKIYHGNPVNFFEDIKDIIHSESIRDYLFKILGERKGLKILDLGCSEAILLCQLLSEYKGIHEFYGVDISQNVINANKKKYGNIIHFYRGDVENIKLPNSFFNLVISTMVIEHVDDENKMVTEIERLLKDKGILLISSIVKTKNAWYYLKNEEGKTVLELSHQREYSSKKKFLSLFTESFWTRKCQVTQLKFPPIDFIMRRFPKVFLFCLKYKTLGKIVFFLRKIRIPIIGYFAIECILIKRSKKN